ncbi:hypothetical protein KAR26_02395 [Candidatus Parcubacteria bacterium]|nr:hypothetical protein [Candidatus Parcubacteria bacterium]
MPEPGIGLYTDKTSGETAKLEIDQYRPPGQYLDPDIPHPSGDILEEFLHVTKCTTEAKDRLGKKRYQQNKEEQEALRKKLNNYREERCPIPEQPPCA